MRRPDHQMRRWHHPLILKIGGVVASERSLWCSWCLICVAPQRAGGGPSYSLPLQDVAGHHPNFHLLGFRASALNSQPQAFTMRGAGLNFPPGASGVGRCRNPSREAAFPGGSAVGFGSTSWSIAPKAFETRSKACLKLSENGKATFQEHYGAYGMTVEGFRQICGWASLPAQSISRAA